MASRNIFSCPPLAGIAVLTIVTLLLASCIVQSDFDEGIALYRQNQLKEALPLFERAAKEDARNPDVHAYLAETLRRMKRIDEAVKTARKAIAMDPCHSFAHTVLAEAYCPRYGGWKNTNADTTWRHLLKAVECDSTDGNAWTIIWIEAMQRGNPALEKKALRSFITTGFLAPPLLAYNRWVLKGLPENSLLLTNGDMDTYPAVALQEFEKIRPDVAIVNLPLLNIPWYARMVRDRYAVPLPFTDKELDSVRPSKANSGRMVTVSKKIVAGWLDMQKAGKFPRPLAVAATVGDRDFTPDSRDRMKLSGPFYLCFPEKIDVPKDSTMLRISLESINPDDFAASFVGVGDRSPVRITHTDRVATNVTALALGYGYLLLESGRASEAYEWATWAEEFESKTKAGPVFAEQIKKLKESAKKKMK
ncbi:tetratricopeptide repeat protein [candidate division TA06 bacterium]|uniref:Tetratricopeptide repeat protein n=1 Tax=candidate division TA06 bacterium TaxID=2250710 RepID=A0A523UXJ4_UNCT6|nr:MAG: tetratricopeptide repeat protein [candidate division TA06 bacterium]